MKQGRKEPLYKTPDCINNERFVQHEEFLSSLKTNLELRVALWCVNNCFAIDSLKNRTDIHIMYYSDLVLHPRETITFYLNENGFASSIPKIDNLDFAKASSTDFDNKFIENKHEQLNKNILNLSNDTKQNIQKIFDYFDFKLYTAFEVLS